MATKKVWRKTMQREADTEATEIVDTDVVDVATVAGTGSSGGGSRRNR